MAVAAVQANRSGREKDILLCEFSCDVEERFLEVVVRFR